MPEIPPTNSTGEPTPAEIRQSADLTEALESAGPDRVPVVGILGGSFSPPHWGHVRAAAEALDQGHLDAVLVVPAFSHAFGKGLVPFGHRLAMARLAFRSLAPRVVVSDLERWLPRPSYTIATVRTLIRGYGDRVQWRLVVGSDVAGELGQWREADALCALAPPLVFNRRGAAHQLEAHDPRVLAQGRQLVPEVSSSEIRSALRREDWVALGPMLEPAVLEYLLRHRLIPKLAGPV